VGERLLGTEITAYLENGGTLEKVAPDGGARLNPHHAALRSREYRVTLDEVVKINIRG